MLTNEELQKLYQYANALTKHDEEAYDLVHQAVIKVQNYQPANFVSYSKTVIRHLFFDKLKKSKRMEPLDHEQTSVVDLESIIIDRFTIRRILNEIDAEDREVLYFWSVEGMTFKEISEELGVKLGTLLSRISRLKARIKSEEVKHEQL